MEEKYPTTLRILTKDQTDNLLGQLKAVLEHPSMEAVDAIRRFRILVEKLYETLCAEEQMAFSGFSNRMHYIHDKYVIPVNLKKEIHAFRGFANKVAHENISVQNAQFKASVRTICLAINHFSSEQIPESIEKIYKGIPKLTLVRDQSRTYETIEFDRAVVTKIETKFQGEAVVLTCESEFDLGKYRLFLRDARYKDSNDIMYGQEFTKIGKLIWKFATINIFNVTKDPKSENIYHTYYGSLIVLEPDYLVDATFLASCFFEDKYSGKQYVQPKLAILEKMSGVKPNPYLLKGAMANGYLDHAIRNPKASFQEIFKNVAGNQVWNVVNMGKRTIMDMKNELGEKHYPNIKEFCSRISSQNLMIEPSFYSSHYGLQGRLDLLIKDDSDSLRSDIIELKSGRPPEEGHQVSCNHEIQVIAYNLLLKSTFGTSRKGSSAILYSQAEHTPLRNVPHIFQLEQKAIRARNELVSYFFSLAAREFRVLGEISPNKMLPPPPYPNQKKLIRDFKDHFLQSTKLEKEYYKEFAAFVLRELQTGKVGDVNPREGSNKGFSSLWHKERFEKEEAFAILSDLKFVDKDRIDASEISAHQVIHFNRPPESFSNFRKGDIAIVYPQDEGRLRPLSYQIHKCTVASLDKKSVALRLHNPQADLDFFKKYEKWVVEHDFMEKGYFSMLESLRLFLGANSRKREILLGQKAPNFQKPETANFQLDSLGFTLSETQQHALQQALLAEDYMLIQGPPGTGKTSRVLLYLLLHLYKYTSETIVVLAFTNKAVEKIIDHIESHNAKQIVTDQVEYLHMASAYRNSERSLTNMAKGKGFDQVQEILNRQRLFIGTIAGFQSHQHLLPGHLELNTLIIDEASQLLEPQVAGIIPRFRRFIMIGDHNQLPAISVQREKLCQVENPELETIGISDLRMSIFERLWKQASENGKGKSKEPNNWKQSIFTLQEHFRMHNEIAALVNPYYNGQLRLGSPTIQTNPLPSISSKDSLTEILAKNRLLFFESPKGSGKSHPAEAKRASKLLEILYDLYGKGFDPDKSAGVITPWRAQINAIKSLGFKRKKLNEVSVDTVERFQGSERDTIIISLATSDPLSMNTLHSLNENEFGLEVDRKLNVALSRAINRIIILGESWVLSKSKHYGRVINHIKKMGGFYGLEKSASLFNDQPQKTDFPFTF